VTKAPPVFSQEKLFLENVRQKIIAELTAYQTRHKLTSLSSAIFMGTEYGFDYAAGYADLDNKIAAIPNHIYTLASVTKSITGAVLIDLVYQNYLSLNDSVYKYLPGFPKNVTVLDLMNHTSGFVREKENENYLKNSSYRDVVNHLPHQFKRKIHRYANFNYAAIGAIIEKVTRRPFAEVADAYYSRITNEHLNFSNRHENNGQALLVKNYVRRGRRQYLHQPVTFGMWEPAALTQTSAPALAKFLRYHMRPEFIDFLSRHAVPTRQRFYEEGHIIKDRYALGFRLRYVDDELLYIYHDGFLYGVLSTFYYFPKKDVGFVALSNMSYYPVNRVNLGELSEVVERIIEEEFNHDIAEYTAKHGYLEGLVYYETQKYHGQLIESRLNEFGQNCLKEKKYNEAINVLKFTNHQFPNLASTYENLGKAYLDSGYRELAVAALQKGLALRPDSVTSKN
jgi:CubicO group peptidase (beta-lactamase class C family)